MNSLNDFPTVKKYLARIGAEPRSLLKAVVKQEQGRYWIDLAIIKFTRKGDIDAPEGYKPNEEEEEKIKVEMSGHNWPEAVFIPDDPNDWPKRLRENSEDNIFWFRDINGKIIMGQVRIVNKDGTKNYIPVTKWSDGEYRWVEPEGDLPLWGIEQLKNNSTVFIHEGVKGAIRCKAIADGLEPDHPWSTELSNAAHLSWIGGALSPHRTDWSVLKKYGVTRVYIVADNDEPGLSAISKIAEELNCVTMSIEFSDQFPKSFDLGDDFPKHMFKRIGKNDYYIGPSFRDCLHMSTWMTNLVPVPAGDKIKMVPVLRHHCKSLWAYVDELELYVNTEFPDIIRKKEALDAMLYSFSHSRKTSELILSHYKGRTPRLTYRPDLGKSRRVVSSGETAINTYIPPSIKPKEGDILPFNEFMEYLIPHDEERRNLMRWCATLIARPDVRMMYGVLLISEMTGTGKSTLSEKILAPLIGLHNVSFPSEKQITNSDFNSWIGKKRLAIVQEIYAGQNFKAANMLKSVITDRYVEINEKFMPLIKLENFISIFASSNSLKALKVDSTDRRWFIPTVTEERWPDTKFVEFNEWLESGGLQIICSWAHTFNDYVKAGEIAPDSKRKQEMIEDGMSEAQTALAMLAKAMNGKTDPVAIGFRDMKQWLATVGVNKIFDSDQELRKAVKEQGVQFSEKRISIGGFEQSLGMNQILVDKLKTIDDKNERVRVAKAYIRKPNDIMEGEM